MRSNRRRGERWRSPCPLAEESARGRKIQRQKGGSARKAQDHLAVNAQANESPFCVNAQGPLPPEGEGSARLDDSRVDAMPSARLYYAKGRRSAPMEKADPLQQQLLAESCGAKAESGPPPPSIAPKRQLE